MIAGCLTIANVPSECMGADLSLQSYIPPADAGDAGLNVEALYCSGIAER